jgi:hypothetical protein
VVAADGLRLEVDRPEVEEVPVQPELAAHLVLEAGRIRVVL